MRAIGLVSLTLAGILGRIQLFRGSPSPPPAPSVRPKRPPESTPSRADHMGCYGYTGAATPAIDGFASARSAFRHGDVSAPLTGPSHATTF